MRFIDFSPDTNISFSYLIYIYRACDASFRGCLLGGLGERQKQGLASGVRCKPLWVDGFLRYLSCDFEFHLAGLDDIHSCG